MKKLYFLLLFCLFGQLSQAQSRAKVYTSFGEFVIFLEDTLAPITAGNFIHLVDTGFYDSVYIHRIVPNFVIQGGDGARSGKWTPPNIQDEFSPLLSNVEKTISMANTGQGNSGNSQFFINLKDNTGLDYDKAPFSSAHPVFGAVIEGWDVVQTIGQQPNSGSPSNTATPLILMDSIRILPPPVGIVQPESKIELSLFPNPANNWLRLRTDHTGILRLHDLDGSLVLSREILSNDELIALHELPSGIYVLSYETAETSLTQKLIITH